MYHRSLFRPTQRSFCSILAALIAVGLLWTTGCGKQGPKRLTVTGKVTFQGAPVTEGQITFEDAASGVAGSTALGTDGSYTLQLPEGNYKVSVEPPVVEVGGTADTPGDEEYKQVDNIPERYWSTATSPLQATVSADATEHNFTLEP